jgi:hypothetical protein
MARIRRARYSLPESTTKRRSITEEMTAAK